jgi:hypothetical protein
VSFYFFLFPTPITRYVWDIDRPNFPAISVPVFPVRDMVKIQDGGARSNIKGFLSTTMRNNEGSFRKTMDLRGG